MATAYGSPVDSRHRHSSAADQVQSCMGRRDPKRIRPATHRCQYLGTRTSSPLQAFSADTVAARQARYPGEATGFKQTPSPRRHVSLQGPPPCCGGARRLWGAPVGIGVCALSGWRQGHGMTSPEVCPSGVAPRVVAGCCSADSPSALCRLATFDGLRSLRPLAGESSWLARSDAHPPKVRPLTGQSGAASLNRPSVWPGAEWGDAALRRCPNWWGTHPGLLNLARG